MKVENRNRRALGVISAGLLLTIITALVSPAQAQQTKPNIMLIVADDLGYGDTGPYGGGRGTRHADAGHRPAGAGGMTFFSFYAQPSCTPGRAAMQTGRIPNRSGMTTVAFQGQGGGLPAAEWTLASVLKLAGYKTFFSGKWHLGEAGLRVAQRAGLRRDEIPPVSIT